MNILAIIRILRVVIPAISALFAAGNLPQVSRNFGEGAGVFDSGILQGGLLPALMAGGSFVLSLFVERSSGLTREVAEVIAAILAYTKKPSQQAAFRVAIELIGVLALIAEKHIPEIAGNLSDIEQKLLAKLGPSAQVRSALGRDSSARAA